MHQRKGTAKESAKKRHPRVVQSAKLEPPRPALWLDLANELLKDGNTPLGLTPKAFAVLRYLHENPQRLVTKKELFAAVWPDTITTDGVLANCISEIRQMLQDSPTTPQYIATVPRRGYRFLAPLPCTSPHADSSYVHDLGEKDPPSVDNQRTNKESRLPLHTPVSRQDAPGTADNNQALRSEAGDLTPDTRTAAGERRQLTVMFCDVVVLTTLTTQLDPEDYHTVLQVYNKTCSDVIARHEGHVAQYLGERILAYFGYPIAHEDAARRAVRAGVEIVATLQDHSITLPGCDPISLHARVGIHSGLVVIEEIGMEGKTERTALGGTVNIAAQLQPLADLDTVVVSADTHRLVAGYVVCNSLGASRLKGLPTPMQVYRVVDENRAMSRIDFAVTTGLTPLVGRESELGLMQQRWAQARAGHGQVLLLSGEPGIGKSRLALSLKELIHHEESTYREFRCSPYYQATALYPVITHLQQLLEFQHEDTTYAKLEKLQRVLATYHFPQADTLPLLATLLSLPHSEGVPPLTLSPQRHKQKLIETLIAWLVEEAERNTVFMLWDDLQWADPSTLEVLALYLDHIPTTRTLAVFVARPEFQPTWGLRSYMSHLTLGTLPPVHSEAMIKTLAGDDTVSSALIRQIVERSDGIPLFVEELTKSILEATSNASDAPATSMSPSIPMTLQDTLLSRLDRLGTARATAQLGAIIGREFSYEMLRAVGVFDEATLKNTLQKLVAAELVYQRGLGERASYTFKHALIQDAAYQSLLKRKRQQLHQQIAHVLQEQFSTTCEAHPELLAYHYAAANQKRQALTYAQKAGMIALQRSANLEAIAHARQALTWLDAIEDDKEQARLELALNSIIIPALMASETNGYASSTLGTTAQRSLEIVESLGEDPHVFPTLWALSAYYHVRSNRPKARRIARRYLDLADRTRNVDQLTVALPVLALCLLAEGNFVEAQALVSRAEQLFADTQNHKQALVFGMDFFSYNCMAYSQVAWAMGYPDKALEQAQLGVTHAQALNHPNTLGLALLYLMMNYQQRREPDEVLRVSQDLDTICEKHGLLFNQSLGALIRNWACGEIEASYPLLAANQSNQMLLGMTYYRSLVAESEATRGNYAQAVTLIDECLRNVEENGERYFLSPLYCLKGDFLFQQDGGEKDVAEECFLRAIEVAQGQKAKTHQLSATIGLCRVWRSGNRLADACARLREIYNEFSEGFTSRPLVDAQIFLRQSGR